jgi:hypothetical protein
MVLNMKSKWATKNGEVSCFEVPDVLSVGLEVSPALEAEEKYILFPGINNNPGSIFG